jgi:hypothetical protein
MKKRGGWTDIPSMVMIFYDCSTFLFNQKRQIRNPFEKEGRKEAGSYLLDQWLQSKSDLILVLGAS